MPDRQSGMCPGRNRKETIVDGTVYMIRKVTGVTVVEHVKIFTLNLENHLGFQWRRRYVESRLQGTGRLIKADEVLQAIDDGGLD